METGKTIAGAGFVKEGQGLSLGHIRLELLKTEEEIIPFTRDKSYEIPVNQFIKEENHRMLLKGLRL